MMRAPGARPAHPPPRILPTLAAAGAAVPYALTPFQTAALAAAYALLFVLPAIYVRRHARRLGSPVSHYWFWSTLFLGVLGVYAYHMDRRVRRKRGELWPGEEA